MFRGLLRNGKDAFYHTNGGIWHNVWEAETDTRSVRESEYIEVVQLLLQNESDIFEDCSTSSHYILSYLKDSIVQMKNQGRLMTRPLPYLQRLQECGFRFDPKSLVWFHFIHGLVSRVERLSAESIVTALEILLGLGLDIHAMDSSSPFPALHFNFIRNDRTVSEARTHNMTEVTTALLQNGADPCALDQYGEFSPRLGKDIWLDCRMVSSLGTGRL